MSKVNQFVERYGVERKGTDSVKWDFMSEKFSKDELLPLWVADMDFKVPEGVRQALQARLDHGVFGYTVIPESYYEAYFNWQKTHYGVTLAKEWLRFSPGVVSSFFWMVNAFTQPADSVLILSPVYYPFYDSIKETGRTLVTSDLINQDGNYTIDFADIEAKIIANKVKLFIHCSPHNPVGRVWTVAEQTQLFDICLKHGVVIVADEIHQDLIRPDLKHVAALSLGEKYYEKLIVLNAPSKTFNLAGLLNSHILIPDTSLRATYDEYVASFHKASTNLIGFIATEAAYRTGDQWLEGLIEVIEHNYEILVRTFGQELPEIIVSPKEGTYLAWVDLSAYVPADELVDFMENRCGIAVDYGEWFGSNCEGFIRINLGTDPKNIQYTADKIVAEIKK